ncbi:ABC transporter permease subunit [Actinomycetota bacterium]
MFANVYTKTLRDLRKGFIGWTIGTVALIGFVVVSWPFIRDMDMSFLDEYPAEMRELFSFDAINTGPGYLNSQLFTSMLPIMFIVYGIGAGARLLASEEDTRTMDVLLATPLSRTRLMLDKAAAAATGLVGLGLVVFLSIWAMASLADMGVSARYTAGASLAMVLLGLLYGAIAYSATAVTGKRSVAIAVSVSLAVAGYVFYLMAALVDALESWKWVTPFHHAIGVGPAIDGSAGIPLSYLWLAIGAVLAVAVSRPIFQRRDIGL